MYKVFINSNVLFISKSRVRNKEGIRKVTCLEFKGAETFTEVIQLFEQEFSHHLCYCVHGDDLALMWKLFRKNYILVTAGGGLVRNARNKMLFIFRNGRWDLPKGKTELNEPIDQTAVREVMEECGMQNIILLKHLTDTYHTYGSPLKRRLKKTVWFRMYSDDKDLQPQEAEGITKIKWVKEEKLDKIFLNSYPSILDVLRAEFAQQPEASDREWHAMANFE